MRFERASTISAGVWMGRRWDAQRMTRKVPKVCCIRGGKLGIVLPSFHNLYQNISQNSVSLRF